MRIGIVLSAMCLLLAGCGGSAVIPDVSKEVPLVETGGGAPTAPTTTVRPQGGRPVEQGDTAETPTVTPGSGAPAQSVS
jgi:hypothetical protein